MPNPKYLENLKRYGPKAADRAADLEEMAALANARPSQLSGGEMQRVAIARALIHRPELLLADEPTGNLDSKNGANILNLLRELSDETGTALLLVTHSPEAAAICHREIELRDGQIVAERLRSFA